MSGQGGGNGGSAGTGSPQGGTTPASSGSGGSAGGGGSTAGQGAAGGGMGGVAGNAGGDAGAGGDGGAGGEVAEGGAGGEGEPGLGAVLRQALVHRYDFEGTGTAVMDRKGTAHGVVVGGAVLSTQQGRGVLVLGGGTTGSYVNLPNGLVSKLTSATLEAWLTWGGGAAWQRVFDFGDSTAAMPEDNPTSGKSYLFLTPATDQNTGGTLRAVFSLDGGSATAETRVDGPSALPLVRAHVALVVDAAQDSLRLYLDGEPAGSQAFTGALSGINDVNCWLGRSQYNADPELGGTLHEFRIYAAALTPEQIAFSAAAGPDAAFLSE